MQRAVKDLSIEQSLKTYEEVWLSKIFELREHTRSRLMIAASKTNTAEKEDEQVRFDNLGECTDRCYNRSKIVQVVTNKQLNELKQRSLSCNSSHASNIHLMV